MRPRQLRWASSLNVRQIVPRCNVPPRTAQNPAIGHLTLGRLRRGWHTASRRTEELLSMALKIFSYAMIGAFVGGLAMTVIGSAGVLMGL